MSEKYAAILHHSRPVIPGHPQMSNRERAAQFAPFAALTGYEDAVEETARLTEVQRDLSEDVKAELDARLRFLRDRLPESPEITACYFVPDARKAGGAYVEKTGPVKTIDLYDRALVFRDGDRVPLDRLRALSGAFFREEFDREQGINGFQGI